MAQHGPDPDYLEYNEDMGLYIDVETGDAYYDDEGNEPAGFSTALDD